MISYIVAQIRDELAPITWHPDIVINCCDDGDEEKALEKLWVNNINM